MVALTINVQQSHFCCQRYEKAVDELFQMSKERVKVTVDRKVVYLADTYARQELSLIIQAPSISRMPA